MTTNEIEKQLKHKAEQQIAKCVMGVVDELKGFSHTHTGINRSGLHWYSKRVKPHKKYTSDPEPADPFCHYDWTELAQLIRRNMEYNLLDSMVERKTEQLLSKIDLFE
tara:strand:+ start:1284 stop:1607 length:324 start_codon:yes stop_codon:yes gene_type:complete